MGIGLIRVVALCCLLPMNALAQNPHNFKVGVWDYSGREDAEVAVFDEGSIQPGGHGVLLLSSWNDANFADHWSQSIATKYDLRWIDAVLIDQPYWSRLGTSNANPCSDSKKNEIDSIRTQLQEVATIVKASSPRALVWINFNEPELQWMMDEQCPAELNSPQFDLLSVDVRWKTFSTGLRRYYDRLIQSAFEGQQLALFPEGALRNGTGTRRIQRLPNDLSQWNENCAPKQSLDPGQVAACPPQDMSPPPLLQAERSAQTEPVSERQIKMQSQKAERATDEQNASGALSVKNNCGAKADGVTDDGPAFNRCYSSGVGEIFVPDGIYRIDTTIIPASNTILRFSGAAKLIAGSNDLTFFRSPVNCFSCRIEDPALDGNGKLRITGFDLNSYRINSTIDRPDLSNMDNGIILNSLNWSTVIYKPRLHNVIAPLTIRGGSNQVLVVFPEIDGGYKCGITISNAGQATTGVQILGGYIQNGVDGVCDSAIGTIISGLYGEGNSDSDIFENGAERSNIQYTQHFGHTGMSGIKGRHTRGALIIGATMGSGNRSIGLYDWDNTNTDSYEWHIATTDSMDAPAGKMSGINPLTQSTYNAAGIMQAPMHFVEDSCTSGRNCTIHFGGRAAFSSSNSFTCTCQNTNTGNQCAVIRRSGSKVSFLGAEGHVLHFMCSGH